MCDWASVAFDDQVDAGRTPGQFARVWVHTHPGNSPQPSLTDEQTFARVFGECDWAIMFILARGGQSYARLQFGVGPRAAIELPVAVEYGGMFPASDQPAWLAEYAACVTNLATLVQEDLSEAPNAEVGYRRGDWPEDAFWHGDMLDDRREAIDDHLW